MIVTSVFKFIHSGKTPSLKNERTIHLDKGRFVPSKSKNVINFQRGFLSELRKEIPEGFEIFTGPVKIYLKFVLFAKTGLGRSDVDNMASTIFDTIQDHIIENDSQIVDAHLSKRLCKHRAMEHVVMVVKQLPTIDLYANEEEN